MDNEQLLKRGICPKCYRPLYESKYTGKILCDCEITTQPMDNTDKLKEIRDKYYKVLYEQEQTDNWVYKLSEVKQIQSQTLEYGKRIGREEVIEEIKRYVEEIQIRVFGNLDQVSVSKILSKPNQLKEQKKWQTRK